MDRRVKLIVGIGLIWLFSLALSPAQLHWPGPGNVTDPRATQMFGGGAKQKVIATAASPCTAMFGSESGVTDSYTNLGSSTSRLYVGNKFQAKKTTTVCKIGAFLYPIGSPTFTVNAAIYSDDGAGPPSAPAVLIGSWSANYDSSTIPGSGTTIYFTGQGAAVVQNSFYWTVLKASTNDSANYVRWDNCNPNTVEVQVVDDDGAAWTNYSTTRALKYEVYE